MTTILIVLAVLLTGALALAGLCALRLSGLFSQADRRRGMDV